MKKLIIAILATLSMTAHAGNKVDNVYLSQIGHTTMITSFDGSDKNFSLSYTKHKGDVEAHITYVGERFCRDGESIGVINERRVAIAITCHNGHTRFSPATGEGQYYLTKLMRSEVTVKMGELVFKTKGFKRALEISKQAVI